MNYLPFQIHDISNPEDLFGREGLIKRLMIDLSLKQNVNIVGARRFGKTCLLKTVYKMIKTQGEKSVFPVYLDFKSNNINGTESSYRYMIGKLVEELYNEGIFTEAEKFGNIEIIPYGDWIDIDEQLLSLSSAKIQNLLEKIILDFSAIIEKTILFMIDEYEYLFKYALDTPVAFMKLRSLSTITSEEGMNVFNFWLTGSSTWDELCSAVPGSGEANTISSTEWVCPLSQNGFEQMWQSECKKIENDELKSYLLSKKNFVYENSGGVPYYVNLIGTYIIKEKKEPDFNICNPFFKELTSKTMNLGEYEILKKISLYPQKIEKSVHRAILINKGIVTVDSKEKLSISIGFLRDYITALTNDNKTKNNPISEIEKIHVSIIKIIEAINNQRMNYKLDPLFKAVLDHGTLDIDLRKPCYSAEQFADFSSALYKTYFERTKNLRNKKLDDVFFHSSEFGKCVDIARHSYGKAHEMDNFVKRDGQLGRPEMLKIMVGSLEEPYKPDEWYVLQIAFLEKFKKELSDIFEFIKKDFNKR